MIPVTELDRIADARLTDAEALLNSGRIDGAVYMCGYAIEIALKARICRTLNWPDFPAASNEFQSYRSFQTHELEVLLHLSGQEARVKQEHLVDWSLVSKWRVESRYNIVGSAILTDAEQMVLSARTLIRAL